MQPFPFSFWKTAAGGGSAPAFGGEVQQYYDEGSGTGDTITLTAGISAGNRAVLMMRIADPTATIVSIVDSKGNTWAIDAQKRDSHPSQSKIGFIASAHCTAALVSGDTVTVTWGTVDGYCGRAASLQYLTNCASSGQPDAYVQVSEDIWQSNAPSASLTTVAANTVVVGMIYEGQIADTASSPSMTETSHTVNPGLNAWHYHAAYSSAGSKTMSSSVSDTSWWAACAVAYK